MRCSYIRTVIRLVLHHYGRVTLWKSFFHRCPGKINVKHKGCEQKACKTSFAMKMCFVVARQKIEDLAFNHQILSGTFFLFYQKVFRNNFRRSERERRQAEVLQKIKNCIYEHSKWLLFFYIFRFVVLTRKYPS